MRKITFDKDMDDETWRDTNFSETELAAARSSNTHQPTADALIKAAEKFGTDGILDSAILLPQFEYKRVQRAITNLGGR